MKLKKHLYADKYCQINLLDQPDFEDLLHFIYLRQMRISGCAVLFVNRFYSIDWMNISETFHQKGYYAVLENTRYL